MVFLRQSGARAGRPLAAVTASAEALALLAFAARRLPAPFFPVDPSLPAETIAALCDRAGIDLVIGDAPRPGMRNVAAGELLAASKASKGDPCLRPGSPFWEPSGDIALLVATSGSTGQPKAVMLTAANLVAAAEAGAAVAPLRSGDIWLACLPLFHIGGFSIIVRTSLAGAGARIHERFDAGRILADLRENPVTHLSLVPAMLGRLLDAEDAPAPKSLRHVLVGGAALSPELAERAAARGWPVQPTYGMSETASQIATLPSLPRPWRAGFVGRPLPGTEVALDAAGRLKVRGPNVMAGYADAALTPGDGLEEGWFTSADLAEIDADGAITILGRADDVIVTGGKKVMPQAVEELLAGAPGVAALAVAGRPDPVWGAIVTAVYSGTAVEAELLAWCRANIEGAARPRAAIRVESLPLLANGKPDRSALKRLAAGKVVEGNETEAGPRR